MSFRYPHLLKKFNTHRPKWIEPHQFLHPNVQNLFELSYFTEGTTSIPNGWQVVRDDNQLPRLSTRQPKHDVSDTQMQSPRAWPVSEESASEEDASPDPSPTTRMVDESSEEDSDFPKVKVRIIFLSPPAGVSGNDRQYEGEQRPPCGGANQLMLTYFFAESSIADERQ